MRTIFIYLLYEGTDAWRPVEAVSCGADTYRITSEREDLNECWQFSTGDLVRCERRTFQSGEQLVAVEKIEPHSPPNRRSDGEALDNDSREFMDLERVSLELRDQGASREDVALSLDERGAHPWNILCILHRIGFGLGESKEWMRQSGRWPEFIDVLDRTKLEFMQALASDPDANAVVDAEGQVSFEYDLTKPNEESKRRVADLDAPPASKWLWLVYPVVLPITLLFLLGRVSLVLLEDFYLWIRRRT